MIVATTYRIEVTADDIRRGNKRNADWCPLARAGTRAVGRPVCVGPTDFCIHRGATRRSKFRVVVRLPDYVIEFAERFDEGLSVEPFSFDLKVRERQ